MSPMQTGVFVIVLAVSGCGSDRTSTGCLTDLDCRGDRICENEACVVAPDEVYEDANNDPAVGVNSCDDDNPCSGDTLCENGRCRAVCAENDDCESGETCEARSSGPGDVCLRGMACEWDGRGEDCVSTWTCTDGTTRALQCEREGRIARCSCLSSSRVVHQFVWDDQTPCDVTGSSQLMHNICGFEEIAPF